MKNLLKTKKGGITSDQVAYLLLALVLVSVVLYIFFRPTTAVAKGLTEIQIEQKIDACEVKGQRLEGRGELRDRDQDGLPDDCDNCPFTPNWGDEVEDMDGDGFPIPIDPAQQKPSSEGGKLCCGNDGTGKDDPKLLEDGKWQENCETEDWDSKYGPTKLILSYIKPKKG